jgi:hypothetical protein
MNGDVAAKANDDASIAVPDDIIFVGDAAEQRRDLDRAAPKRKPAYQSFWICGRG